MPKINEGSIDYLKKNILSCNNADTHETMNQWLERLFKSRLLDEKNYLQLKQFNDSLSNNKFFNKSYRSDYAK